MPLVNLFDAENGELQQLFAFARPPAKTVTLEARQLCDGVFDRRRATACLRLSHGGLRRSMLVRARAHAPAAQASGRPFRRA